MTMSNHDLDWVAAQRPGRSAADTEAHDRALLALLRHATARPSSRRDRGLNIGAAFRSRTFAITAAVGMAAIAAAVVLSAEGGSQLGHGGSSVQAVVTHHGSPQSPLVRLADRVGTDNAPGDATLIARTTMLRSNAAQGPRTVTVYDLYADNGKYYFSHNEGGLAGQVSSGNNQAGALFAREVAAAEEAAAGNVQQGGLDMAKAPDPNQNIDVNQPVNWTAVKAKLQVLAASGDRQAAAQLAAGPGAQGTLYDNWAWENSQDALMAGTADPQVRAGVLRILATLPGVTVTSTTADNQPALVLSSGPQETGVGYTEQLTINADTGQPIEFVGKSGGSPAATTVDYKVARVTLSSVAAGRLPAL
jgi:hypothetical protein